MVLPRDPRAQQPTSELPDFSQVRGLRRVGPGRYTITSLGQRLLEEGRGCFYAAEPDSDSETDSYDPTRKCYHIDGTVEITDETQDAAAGGRALAAREDSRTPGSALQSRTERRVHGMAGTAGSRRVRTRRWWQLDGYGAPVSGCGRVASETSAGRGGDGQPRQREQRVAAMPQPRANVRWYTQRFPSKATKAYLAD